MHSHVDEKGPTGTIYTLQPLWFTTLATHKTRGQRTKAASDDGRFQSLLTANEARQCSDLEWTVDRKTRQNLQPSRFGDIYSCVSSLKQLNKQKTKRRLDHLPKLQAWIKLLTQNTTWINTEPETYKRGAVRAFLPHGEIRTAVQAQVLGDAHVKLFFQH